MCLRTFASVLPAWELVKARLAAPLATGQVELARCEAVTWLGAQAAASLDWLYLDDDHTYQHVLQELELARKCVRPGGWILGHDYCEVLPGVSKAVNEFCGNHGLAISFLTDEELLPVFPGREGMPATCSYNSFAIQIPSRDFGSGTVPSAAAEK